MRMVRMVGQAGAHAASVMVEAPGGGMMHVRCKLIWTKLNYKGDKGDMNKNKHIGQWTGLGCLKGVQILRLLCRRLRLKWKTPL